MFGKNVRSAKEDVAELHSELQKLDQAVKDLDAARDAAEKRIAAARDEEAVTLLDAQLSGQAPDGAGSRLIGERARLEAICGAILEASKRRADIQRHLELAQAREAREQAGALRSEADKRERRTRELLAQLQEHEGCEYVPGFSDRPMFQVTPDGTVRSFAPITKTYSLRQEADNMVLRAQALEWQVARLTDAK
jgi:DNA repair exonuclease SbcCD ATPase subunit